MLHVPILRWGKPYESLEVDEIVHFRTGEPIAKVSHRRVLVDRTRFLEKLSSTPAPVSTPAPA